MGFNKIFWGFLFVFFDFRIQGFDIIPDIIGYWLIYLGLNELVSMSSHFIEAKKYSVILGILSILDIYEIKMPMDQFSISPINVFFMILGILLTILNLLMVFHICNGIAELAESKGLDNLQTIALNRWKYYLYVAITTVVYQPLALMLPQLAIVLFIPLVIVAFIVFVLIQGLIKQAENLLAA